LDDRLRSHYATYERVIGFTRVADVKAAPLLAFHSALIGVLVGESGSIVGTFEEASCSEEVGMAILIAIYAATTLASLTSAALVYLPVTPPANSSLVYFEDIKAMKSDEFVGRSKALDSEMIEDHLLDQIHRVSAIASKKFARIRVSMLLAAPAFAAWCACLVLALS
jgi:hypothetical protein